MSSQDAEKTPRWYIINTYSGYENKVKQSIETKTENQGMTDQILDVRIPQEETTEIIGGKEKVTTSKIYPGYVLVYMIHNDEVAYLIRSIRGVTGFLGADPNKPIPLTDEEVKQMGVTVDTVVRDEIVCDIKVGDMVRISAPDGSLAAFNGQLGKVAGIDLPARTCTVMVRYLNREIPYEIPLTSVTADL